MSGLNAPPQAYTRDTLVKAIDWIAHQSDAIRGQATNADSLVALYLQSKRRNGASSSSSYPVSGEAFTEDLKSLAKDLEKFSTPQQAPPTQKNVSFEPSPKAQGNAQSWHVDSRSWTQAKALKERLNLSSEGEALRMMIALGAEKLNGLLS